MVIQNVVFLPYEAHFEKIVVGIKGLGLPHVLKLVVGKQGHAPCEKFLLQQILFLCQLNFLRL